MPKAFKLPSSVVTCAAYSNDTVRCGRKRCARSVRDENLLKVCLLYASWAHRLRTGLRNSNCDRLIRNVYTESPTWTFARNYLPNERTALGIDTLVYFILPLNDGSTSSKREYRYTASFMWVRVIKQILGMVLKDFGTPIRPRTTNLSRSGLCV